MKKILTLAIYALVLSAPVYAADWVLEQSTITYHVSHLLHHVEGTSHAARGKGVCTDGQCQFLIADPVDTFNSSDSNRDLHMLQDTRGAQFPMVVVRTTVPENLGAADFTADITIEFAGQKFTYPQVKFHRTDNSSETRLTGTIPLNILDFKIIPPSLLTVAIKNEVPVDIDMTWRR